MPTFIYNQLNMINCVQFININTSTCQSTFYNSIVLHNLIWEYDKWKRKRIKEEKIIQNTEHKCQKK